MAESVELKPCPHCGSDEVSPSYSMNVENVVSGRFVECEDCSACGPVYPDEAKAIAAWNRRAPAPEQAGDVEGLIAELAARANARHSGEPSPTAQLCARAADALLSLSRRTREREYAWGEMKNAQAYWRAETSHAEQAEARAEAAERLLAAAKDFLKNLWKCDATVGMGREIDALKAAVEQAETRPR